MSTIKQIHPRNYALRTRQISVITLLDLSRNVEN